MTEAVGDMQTAVLGRLRVETRSEHSALEAVLDLTGRGLTRARYRRTLERFYGYYRPLEPLVGAGIGRSVALDLDDRCKAPLLEADLRALGVAAPDRLPSCLQLPRIGSAAAALGCLYVMEGATLGGQLISRHVQQTLGVTCQTGGSFFYGYGPRTGAMWQAFRAAVVAVAGIRDTDDEMVATALRTFPLFVLAALIYVDRRWLPEADTSGKGLVAWTIAC